MRRIAIIGAGQAGLCLGIGLLKAGYRVTLFSENTPEAILNSQPKGLPILFPNALQIERDLGLNFWEEQYLGCNQFCNQTCNPQGNIALTVSSPLEKPWIAVDQRLKSFYWMQDFVDSGELIVQKMTPNDLDPYAALTKKLIQQLIPWNFEAIKDTQLSDAQAWLRGAITPTVRKPIAYLASKRAIMGIGSYLTRPCCWTGSQ